MQFQSAVWWQQKASEINFSAKWIPQKIPTLIVGAKYDCICPFSLFEKDTRFKRANIELLFLEDAGRVHWVENPGAVREAFHRITSRMTAKNNIRSCSEKPSN